MPTPAGMIYIAGSFETVHRTAAGRRGWNTDNDPHFWSAPPTWGICRNDLRAKAKEGQTIFFVLPLNKHHPQMILGYMTIEKIVRHDQAHALLPHKRMRGARPDGNILVDSRGRYSEHDDGHEEIFSKVRWRYAIGDPANSRFLTPEQIRYKAPKFVPILRRVLNGGRNAGARAIDYISRYGNDHLSQRQVDKLRGWVDKGLVGGRGFEGEVTQGGVVAARRCRPQVTVCGPRPRRVGSC